MDEHVICEVCSPDDCMVCQVCGLNLLALEGTVTSPGTDVSTNLTELFNEYSEFIASDDALATDYCFNCGIGVYQCCINCGQPGVPLEVARRFYLRASKNVSACLQCYYEPCICPADGLVHLFYETDEDNRMPPLELAFDYEKDVCSENSFYSDSDSDAGLRFTTCEVPSTYEVGCCSNTKDESGIISLNPDDDLIDETEGVPEASESTLATMYGGIEGSEAKDEEADDTPDKEIEVEVDEGVGEDEEPEEDEDGNDADEEDEDFTIVQKEYMDIEKEFIVSELPEVMPKKLLWADIEFDDDEDVEFRTGFTDINDTISDFACCPRCFMEKPEEDFDSLLPRAVYCLSSFPNLTKLECKLNSIRNPVYTMCYLQKNNLLTGVQGVFCADLFLRSRHENLSMLCAEALGMDATQTDCKFSDVFQIDSDRTPDFISKVGDSDYLIIEVTATSDVEKAAKGKGIASLGYEPKYELEIRTLKMQGLNIEYVVVVFDMVDYTNEGYKTQLESCASILRRNSKVDFTQIEFVRREYCTCSQHFNKLFGVYFGHLFNKNFRIGDDQSSGWGTWMDPNKDWFSKKYEVVKVNMFIYDKLAKNQHKLLIKLDQLERSSKSGNADLNYDAAKSSFSFRDNPKSVPLEMWKNMLVSENYDSICLMLKYRISGVANPIPKAEIEYFQLVTESVKFFQLNLHPFYSYHPTSYLAPMVDLDLEKYQGIYSEVLFGNFKYLDDEYESKLIKSITEMDSRFGNDVKELNDGLRGLQPKPFSAMKVNKSLINDAVVQYKARMEEINSGDGSLKITHAKPPFLYPVYKVSEGSYKDYKTKPSFLKDLTQINLGPLTNRILQIANNDTFTFGGNKLAVDVNSPIRKKLAEVSRMANSLQKEYMRSNRYRVFPKLPQIPGGEELSKQLSDLNMKLRSETKGIKKEYSLIRLPTSGKSEMRSAFESEMQHFKKKGSISVFKGIGLHVEFSWSEICYNNLKNVLSSQTGVNCPDEFYSDFVADDTKMLKDLKEKHISDNSLFKKYLMGTFLYHSAAFVSRLCHTLMFLSQTPTGGDNFCIDNLGYDDVILIVKGGKKVFGTKRSRLFRLIHPTFESCVDMHFPKMLDSSYRQINVGGKLCLMTPWMNLHETLLSDGITFLNRTAGYITLNRGSDPFKEEVDKCFFNVILSYHNRRKTESFLHNLRYITMNCLSIFSNVSDMLKELAGFNYDCLQSYIRGCISEKFYNFAFKLKILHDNHSGNLQNALKEIGLVNIFNGHPMKTVHDLANSVYSTYLMSKAPTTQVLEQYSNFRDMLETHKVFSDIDTDVFDGKLDVTIDDYPNFADYYSKLHESDFNYDPKFCITIGKFMSDYLSSNHSRSFLQMKWDKILNEPWDEFANTKGLRGDGEEFFGTKGYYVVYKDYLDRNPDYLVKLAQVLSSDETQDRKKKTIDKLNESYRDVLKDEKLDSAVFHVVDKKQRGGRREIFVMDIATKKQQQPIEKFCSEVCKLIPNEMISIPSNKRLSAIHSKVFEGQRTNGEHFYLVFDCRKWAPRSLVHKFVLFLSGMKELLPNGFLLHCYSFLFKMTNKRLYTKPHIVEMLKKNKAVKDVDFEWLIEDSNRKGYYMNMSYSWMMGIFNYFSSLMHVANQMYIAHLLRVTTSISYNTEFHLQMVAHSDDSAGKAVCKDEEHMARGLFIYQTLLKSSNHMLSMKKSNCGKAYYEFLSILYIGGTLLSLLAKFTGLFNFHPSDGGYCQDISEAYSKCVELFMNGATFDKCYIAFKIQVSLVRRFYFQSSHDDFLYNYPPCMLGIPDAHPLMIIMCGSDADLVRIMYQNMKTGGDKNKVMLILNEVLSGKTSGVEGFLKTIKASPNVKMHKRLKELKESFEVSGDLSNPDLLWPLVNVNFRNSAMNAVKFLKKLDDKIFLASLQDESLTRRISRSYYFRSALVLDTSRGVMSYKQVKQIMAFFELRGESGSGEIDELAADIMEDIKKEVESFVPRLEYLLFNFLHSEPVRLYKYLDKLDFDSEKLEPNIKKTKPLKVFIKRSLDSLDYKFSPQEMATWIKYPELRLLLPNTRNFMLIEHEVEQCLMEFKISLNELTVEQLSSVLMKMSKKSDINIFCYSNVPTSLREVTTYQDLLNLLAHNSFPDKYIKGISIPFGKTIGVLPENVLDELSDADVQWTLSLILLMTALLKDNAIEDIWNMDLVVPVKFSTCTVKLLEVVDLVINYWLMNDQKIYGYLKADLQILNKMVRKEPIGGEVLENSYYHSFVKRQFLAQNVWMGVGQLLIGLGDMQLCFLINGQKISGALSKVTEYSFSLDQVKYINLILRSAQLFSLRDSMREIEVHESESTFLGFDRFGNLSIDSGEYFTIGMSVQIDYNLRTELSEPKCGRIDLIKGSKIRWSTVVNDRIRSYTVNTISVNSSDAINLLRGLIAETDENKDIIRSLPQSFSFDLLQNLYKNLDVELELDKGVFFENIHNTKVYKILKTCKEQDLCKVKVALPRLKSFPAQEGGLLCALIEYSKVDKDFDFKWDRVLTREYMNLKSTQPEAFMTNLMTNLEENFRNLYDADDKTAIMKELQNLAKIKKDENFEETLFSMLCNWGYIGVAGALETAGSLDLAGSFRNIRVYRDKFPFKMIYINTFHGIFPVLYDAILISITELGSGAGKFAKWHCLTVDNVKFHFMSFVHSIVLKCYANRVPDDIDIESCSVYLQTFFETICCSSLGSQKFNEGIKTLPLLSNLVLNGETLDEWVRVFYNLRIMWIEDQIQKGVFLDFLPRMQRLDVETPFKKTQKIVENCGLKLTASNVYHHGVLGNEYFDQMSRPYRGVSGRQALRVISELLTDIDSITSVDFNLNYWLPYPLSDDFTDADEFEDFIMEFQCSEIDTETIDQMIEDFEGPVYKREKAMVTKINEPGIKTMITISLKLIFLFGTSSSVYYLSKIRQAGVNVAIIGDYIPYHLVKNDLVGFRFYRLVSHRWINKSIINPGSVYISLMSKYGENEYWESFFGAKRISIEEMIELININTSVQVNRLGMVEDCRSFINMSAENANELFEKRVELDQLERVKSNEEASTSGNGVNDEQNRIIEMMKKKGFDHEIIESFLKRDENDEATSFRMMEILKSILKNEDYINSFKGEVLEMTADILKKPMTSRQNEQILQIAPIMASMQTKSSDFKNRVLDDKELLAELNCIAPNCIYKIITNRLNITPRLWQVMYNKIKTYRRLIKTLRKNVQDKIFLLNLFTLMINDTNVIVDSNENDEKILVEFSDWINHKFIDDEEDEDDEEDMFSRSGEGARINYGLAFEPSRFHPKDKPFFFQ
jgi:hypothetical protein